MAALTPELAQALVDEQGLDVVIPDIYTSIDDKAFTYKQLTSIEIPDSIISIGDEAFYGNYDLKSIKIGNSVESIGDYAFGNTDNEGTGSEYISIPDSVKTIGDGAFYALYNLESIEIGSGLTSIPDFAFAHSSGLKKATIPSGIESIGHAAFHNTSLTEVVIPKSIKAISAHAFDPSVNIVYDSQGTAPIDDVTDDTINPDNSQPDNNNGSDSQNPDDKTGNLKSIAPPEKFKRKFVDKITNFNPSTDTLEFDTDSFGIDSSATFATGKNKKTVKKKLSKQDFDFLYDEKKGGLYFNENGSDKGFGDGGIIAILKGAPDLTSDNLEFI